MLDARLLDSEQEEESDTQPPWIDHAQDVTNPQFLRGMSIGLKTRLRLYLAGSEGNLTPLQSSFMEKEFGLNQQQLEQASIWAANYIDDDDDSLDLDLELEPEPEPESILSGRNGSIDNHSDSSEEVDLLDDLHRTLATQERARETTKRRIDAARAKEKQKQATGHVGR